MAGLEIKAFSEVLLPRGAVKLQVVKLGSPYFSTIQHHIYNTITEKGMAELLQRVCHGVLESATT